LSTTLRLADPADAEKLSLVGGASFLESFANDHPGGDLVAHVRERHSSASYARLLSNADYAVWILEEALGAPIGYAMLGPADLPGAVAGDLELKRIYVLHRWHGTGQGRALFEAVQAEAVVRGAHRLLLAVYKANVAAQGFYKSQGFDEIGRTRFDVGKTAFEDLVFAKMLRP
jgi:diamine N-acetyltransferase